MGEGKELEEPNVIKAEEWNFTAEPKGMGYAFFHAMKKYKDETAQIDGLTGIKDSYGSLLQRSVRTAISMRQHGLTRDDIIGICSNNHLNACVPFIASQFVGCKVCNFDPSISPSDTAHLINLVKPKMMFVVPQSVELIEEAVRKCGLQTELVVFGTSAEHAEFSDFLVAQEGEREFQPYEQDDPKETAVILFSSGTTGLPKGICLPHAALMANSVLMRSMGYTLEIGLPFASLYWISAVLAITLSVLYGKARVIVPKFDAELAWKLFDKYRVTYTFMAPVQALAITKAGRPEGIDTTSLIDVIVGGGPATCQQMADLRDVFPGTNVSLAYGMTELVGFATCFSPNVRKQLLLSVKNSDSSGLPVPGVTIKVVDPETDEALGPHKRGEIRIKSDIRMSGYYNMDSSDAFDEKGFVKTGDIGYYDEDHCFFIVDRIKEMLKFRSWHVPPAILEGVMLTHPAVASGIVIGIPHEEDGDHPMGVVVIKPGFEDTTAEDIRNYVDERVDDRQKLRAGVKIVNEIPFTPSGKPRKRLVRTMILDGEL